MSIRIRVLLHANFREIVGKREITAEIDSNSRLRHIMEELAKKYGRDFKQIVEPNMSVISSEFLVSINGRNTRDPNIRLNNGDIIMITIPAGGG